MQSSGDAKFASTISNTKVRITNQKWMDYYKQDIEGCYNLTVVWPTSLSSKLSQKTWLRTSKDEENIHLSQD